MQRLLARWERTRERGSHRGKEGVGGDKVRVRGEREHEKERRGEQEPVNRRWGSAESRSDVDILMSDLI